MRSAVITFPGSNCDRDLAVAFEQVAGRPALRVWHGDHNLPDVDIVGVPGGFSYGDYLRCGAMAARSPIMAAVAAFARRGGAVLGICNGFQILTECGLLPGALIRNTQLRFVCRWAELGVDNTTSRFTSGLKTGQRLRMPVAHHDGQYVADAATLERLEGEGQVAFRYRDNPNGSVNEIAGLLNLDQNVLGMMPHPERAIDDRLGGVDGAVLLRSALERLS